MVKISIVKYPEIETNLEIIADSAPKQNRAFFKTLTSFIS